MIIVFVVPRENFIEDLSNNFYAGFYLFRQEMLTKNIEMISVVKEKFNQSDWLGYRKDEILFLECAEKLIDENKLSDLKKYSCLKNFNLQEKEDYKKMQAMIENLKKEQFFLNSRHSLVSMTVKRQLKYDDITDSNSKIKEKTIPRSFAQHNLSDIDKAAQELEKILVPAKKQGQAASHRASTPVLRNYTEENYTEENYDTDEAPDTEIVDIYIVVSNAIAHDDTEKIVSLINRNGVSLLVDLMLWNDLKLEDKEYLLSICEVSSVNFTYEVFLKHLFASRPSGEVVDLVLQYKWLVQNPSAAPTYKRH